MEVFGICVQISLLHCVVSVRVKSVSWSIVFVNYLFTVVIICKDSVSKTDTEIAKVNLIFLII